MVKAAMSVLMASSGSVGMVAAEEESAHVTAMTIAVGNRHNCGSGNNKFTQFFLF